MITVWLFERDRKDRQGKERERLDAFVKMGAIRGEREREQHVCARCWQANRHGRCRWHCREGIRQPRGQSFYH